MPEPAAANALVLDRPEVIVVDIEGTLPSTWYVRDELYPYSRKRFTGYFEEYSHKPEVARARRQIIDLAGLDSSATAEDLTGVLEAWMDEGQMPAPLRTMHALIWQEGFAAGEFVSFSNGTLPAQRAWFSHSPEGNLIPLIKGHFSLESAGAKHEVSSFRNITHDVAEALGKPREKFLFFSDQVEALDAARQAGWNTVGVRRPGDQFYDAGVGDHPEIQRLNQVRFIRRYASR
ncbi:MAG: acireductone synthase [Kocuria rhizophila]|nr:MAG: acireductone synthase [Kocuria rhizophila]